MYKCLLWLTIKLGAGRQEAWGSVDSTKVLSELNFILVSSLYLGSFQVKSVLLNSSSLFPPSQYPR